MNPTCSIASEPSRVVPTDFRLCTVCLQELPADQFRPRGHGSPKRHSWCRTCRNTKERERSFLAKAKRERRRVGAMLTAIRAARSDSEVAYVCRLMLHQFGGTTGLVTAYRRYHADAMASGGFPVIRALNAAVRVMKHCDDAARRRLPRLSDTELRERRDLAILEMLAQNPESVAELLRSQGWTVEPPCAGEVDSVRMNI